ncbi:hypothetical protein Tsubulata_041624 [Turnera subulata]|uniref:Uncharacterized protein n=1 Tax=Turnera subulata TaxID=218843 RepID=A0A9Q0FX50_9ROSI|nr:hypothetical protein Tsubulata_041624 [Turnera subulata]
MERAAAENQTFPSPCFFKASFLCATVLVPSLLLICFLTFGYSPYLVTLPILFLSTIFLTTFSKKRVLSVENQPSDESPTCYPEGVLEKVGEEIKPELEISPQANTAKQNEGCIMHEYQVESTDFPSDSESSEDFLASGSFELTWNCSNNVGQSITVSESSVSDDEEDGDDLIEISLPVNNSGHASEGQKQKLPSDLPDYLPEPIYRQESLMELLSEINEINDENLIEIDLSVDSIKSSRFEIEG